MSALARWSARAVVCAAMLTAAAPRAAAQVYIGRDTPRTGSWEVSGGALWSQGYDQGDAVAQLTRNPGTGTGSFDLFTTGTRVDAAPGVQGRLAFYVTRAVALEGGVQYSRPVLSTAISSDSEDAADATADETLARYVFDGSLVLHFTGATFAGGNGVPFVAGGGGYVRELHDGYGVVETGNEFHGAVGVKYWFSRARRRLGLRAEAGVSSRSGGADFSDSRRTLPTAAVSLAYLF